MTSSSQTKLVPYKTTLSCFSFTCSSQSEEIINRCRYSNKILLPPDILRELMARDLFTENDIMFFKVINKKIEFGVVCSVQEFTASPGMCHIPYHIMEELAITEGETVEIEKVSPPKGTYVKLRPQETAFIEMSNPKAILEKIMCQDYPVITEGQTITINYKDLGKIFSIDILETQPEEVVSIIDTDLNVEFGEPADYIAPSPPPRSSDQKCFAVLRRDGGAGDGGTESLSVADQNFVLPSEGGPGVVIEPDATRLESAVPEQNGDDPGDKVEPKFSLPAIDGRRPNRGGGFVPFSGRGYRLG